MPEYRCQRTFPRCRCPAMRISAAFFVHCFCVCSTHINYVKYAHTHNPVTVYFRKLIPTVSTTCIAALRLRLRPEQAHRFSSGFDPFQNKNSKTCWKLFRMKRELRFLRVRKQNRTIFVNRFNPFVLRSLNLYSHFRGVGGICLVIYTDQSSEPKFLQK
jgi:hypothetical protein